MPVPFLACMTLVASIYHLPPRVLPSIQAVEGGRPGLVHRNSNATEDLGVMQVNTLWLWPLARYTRTTADTVYARLRDEPCYNIAAAGAIMRGYLNETGGDVMRAVGNYHSHTAELNLAYQGLVMQSARRLFEPGTVPAPAGATVGGATVGGRVVGGVPVLRASATRTVAQRIALQKRMLRRARG
ncbi:MAG: lytic transglycosylase domain-containing protein [Gluconacetobacter diazotrophicus]|nr:lytic transglycosylase domain-containing protein [Gluconacetobacter diazotrophicus]